MITLKHEKHGTHFALSELEAQSCEKNGWVRQTEVVEVPTEPPWKRYEAKFGKRPHHRMKYETMLKALEE